MMMAIETQSSRTVPKRVIIHGASGRTTSIAAVWLAELRPISTGLTPQELRISDSSGQVSPRVIETTDMEATTMAMLRRRSAALRVNAVMATKGAPRIRAPACGR